jgi:hypothetical protein
MFLGKQSIFILAATPALCFFTACYGSSRHSFEEDWQVAPPDDASELSGEMADGDASPGDAVGEDGNESDHAIEPPLDLPEDAQEDEEDGVESGRMATCEEVRGESHYCVTIVDYGTPLTALMGLETGNLCLLNVAAIESSFRTDSIGWIDPFVFICSYPLGDPPAMGIVRVSTLDGLVEYVPQPCWVLTTYHEGILVLPEPMMNGLRFFNSFDDALAGIYEVIPTGPFMGENITVQGDRLYSGPISPGEILVFQLPSGESQGSVMLEDFDEMVGGISVTEDGLVALNIIAPWTNVHVAVFDLATGRPLWNVYPPLFRFSHQMTGLYCMPGR